MADLNDDDNFGRMNEASIRDFNREIKKEENYSSMYRMRHQSSQGLIDTDSENSGAAGSDREFLDKVYNGFVNSRINISEQNQ